MPKSSSEIFKEFFCKGCDYKTSKISNWKKHILTRKHKMVTMDNNTVIMDNPALTSLTGLESLNYVGGTVMVNGNSALLSLTGIENLDSIGLNLWIVKNIHLENLSALTNLISIGSEIVIDSK